MKDNQNQELSWLSEQVTKRKIGRRDFIGRAAALGVTTALAGTLYSQALQAAEPKQGGNLRVGLGHGSTTDSMDPATFENGFMATLNFGTNNTLTEIGADGSLQPELAESWEASADAAQWTFKLRKGVEFHNGKTMTARDVLASINHHRGEDSKSAAKPIVDPIEDIQVDGDDTVIFTLAGGNADFPFIMSDYHLAIQPAKEDGTMDWEGRIGTGGYVLKDFEPGVRAHLTRNPNYWKEGSAHLDEAELISIIDVTARTNALNTGEIDVMDRCDIKTLHLLERNDDLRIGEATGYAHFTIPMRTDTPPFDNNDVRLALKLA
ncbi:MAG: ABC transporter substrate-binding protein, partial [Pseudomonadota bacterium]